MTRQGVLKDLSEPENRNTLSYGDNVGNFVFSGS